MCKISMMCLLACLITVGFSDQGVDTEDCVNSKVESCNTDLSIAIAVVGRNKRKICSAANKFLNCLNEVVKDCDLDLSSNLAVRTGIATAKQKLKKAGCRNGAGGSVYSIVVVVVGVCLQRLF